MADFGLKLLRSLSTVHNRKVTKNALTLTTQKSPWGVSLSLSHTHVGLPEVFNLNFPTSIPVTFNMGVPPAMNNGNRTEFIPGEEGWGFKAMK